MYVFTIITDDGYKTIQHEGKLDSDAWANFTKNCNADFGENWAVINVFTIEHD